MKLKFYILLSLYFIVSCSLYVDDEQPDIFFEYTDFDILELGGTYSDMIITADGHFIFLADYNNNRILKINTGNTMNVVGEITLGSHPGALDLNSDGSVIAVALEGESKVTILDVSGFEIINSFSISLMNVNDLAFVNDTTLIISSRTDPSCISLNLNSAAETSQSVLNGELAMDREHDILYVATSASIKKYNWDGVRFSQDSNISDPYGFSGDVHHFVYCNSNNTVFACISSIEEGISVRHVYSYNGADMTFAGKYLIKSPGLAVAVSMDGQRVFTAPTDADEMGVFVIEFDQETKLESNYYLSAGNLTDRGLILDPQSQFLYILVNIPGDDDSFEPYNDYSFDLQRIKL
ncbi:MAG: hypothetical protein QGI47_08890 [Candidatus Marinimicrobia bacterium]|nr:hypothetical protein [Candidatus Neomarinimicrobiota bacterium]